MAKVTAQQFLSGLGEDVTCPFFDRRGALHLLLQNAGVIVRLDEAAGGKITTVHSTEGQPSGAVSDRASGGMYVADFGHCAVLSVSNAGEQDSVVAVYEDRPLKGPNSVCMDGRGNVFFTDSGPLGETGLAAPFGSLFMIASSPGGQILKPVSLNNLAYPSGVACTQNGSFIYVAEMMNNRLLRYFERPEGVYHGSVFYQFAGGVGPSSVAVDKEGNVFVAHYDILGNPENPQDGRVYVISPTGKLMALIVVPAAPQVSGVAVKDGCAYITEQSSGCVFKAEDVLNA